MATKNIRTLSLGCIAILSVFLLSSCGSKNDGSSAQNGAASFTLKFGHLASEDHTWHKAAVKFKELVESRSEGKIKVSLYPNLAPRI